jgi:amino acid transporter
VLDQIEMLGTAEAPLNDLAIKYVSKDFATAIHLAAARSASSCVIGAVSAAARLLFALGRAGLAQCIGDVDDSRGTPGAVVILTGGLCLISILVSWPFVGQPINSPISRRSAHWRLSWSMPESQAPN